MIGVIGAGTPSPSSLASAREIGRLIAERGWIVLTGGRPAGVMAAACAGAKQVPGSLTLGILPGAAEGAGPEVDLAVFTGMGDARNVINVLTSDALVACGVEGPGTLSEVALAVNAQKPVVLLGCSPAACAMLKEIRPAGKVLEAEQPLDAIRLLQEVVGISSWAGHQH